jgi:hypothetical protein
MKFVLMITNLGPHYKYIHKYNPITSSIFHEKLPDDDPAWSKHVVNVQNKTNDNTVTLIVYYEFVVLTAV